MTIRNISSALAALTLFTLSPAFAVDELPPLAVGTRLGLTTGLGFEASYGLNRWVDLRAAYNIGYVEFDDNDEDVVYRGKLDYSSAAGFVDYKPFAGGFRLTAGLYSNPLKLDLKASGTDDYELGDRTYYGDLALNGGVRLGSPTPYLGIGWGGTTNGSGFGASLDLGLQFTSSANAKLRAVGRACEVIGDTACNPNGPQGFDVNGSDPRALAFQNDLDREIDELEDDAKDFKLMPVIQVGLHYRFGGKRNQAAPAQTQASSTEDETPPPPVKAASGPTPAAAGARSLTIRQTLRLRTSPVADAPAVAKTIPAGTAISLKQRLDGGKGVWWFVTGNGTAGWAQESELPLQ